MREPRCRAALAAFGIAFFPSSAAHAQAWNTPIGGRTATMGGASVAEGHDIAAPLMNPAGIAAVDVQVFGLSSTAYAYSIERVPSFFTPRGVDPSFGRVEIRTDDYSSSSVGTLPSAVGYFRHFGAAGANEPGHLVVGLAAISPLQISQPANGTLDAALLSTNGSIQWRRAMEQRLFDLYVGPTAGLVITKDFRAGVSVLGLYRNRRMLDDSSFQLSSQAGNLFGVVRGSTSIDSTSFAAVAVAGAQLRVVSDLWVGASVHAPSLLLYGSSREGRSESSAITTPDPGGSSADFREVKRDLDYRHVAPPRISIGTAWVRPAKWAVAADTTVVVGWEGAELASGLSRETSTTSGSATRDVSVDFTRRISTRTVIDLSIGGELYLARNVALRAGYGQASDPRPLPDAGEETIGETRRDYRTVTLGVGLVFGPFDTTFGVAWQSMRGTVDVRDVLGRSTSNLTAPTVARQEITGDTFMALIHGTVSEESAKRELMQRVAGIPPEIAAAARVATSVQECPKSLDAKAIERFDYSSAFAPKTAEAERAKRALLALAELRAAVDDLDTRTASAAAAIAETRARLGASVDVAVSSGAECKVHGAPSCSDVCSRGDAACALSCEARALGAGCEPNVDVKIEGAADAAAAEEAKRALVASFSAIASAAATLAARVRAVAGAGAEVASGVRAVADLLESDPAHQGLVAACLLAPLARMRDPEDAKKAIDERARQVGVEK